MFVIVALRFWLLLRFNRSITVAALNRTTIPLLRKRLPPVATFLPWMFGNMDFRKLVSDILTVEKLNACKSVEIINVDKD